MADQMLYPIWQRLPRPRFFPDDLDLNRLLANYFHPGERGFRKRMKRRNARDLRKGLFGSKGLLKVPDKSGGVMAFDLPNGWTLRLTYYAAGEYDFEHRRATAGDVDAEFIPPRMSQRHGIPSRDGERGAEEAHPA
jgi:hypothetical protein